MKYYVTQGEFLQALKDISELKEKIRAYKKELKDLEYLRFNKVKSPLDYDIIGYDNEGSIRQLKTRSYVSESQKNDNNRALDKQIEDCEEKIKTCENRVKKALYELNKLKKPLKDIVEDKYIKGLTYREIINKYPKIFSGVVADNYVLRYIVAKLDNYFEN